jgi:hypothetical protein
MRVIETTAHVGSDGMLRLEVPLEQRDGDVQVAVVVESSPALPPTSAADKWAPIRSHLEAAGMRVPPPGLGNAGPIEPVSLPGPPASELLIRDRR